jgi:hypothetical protein
MRLPLWEVTREQAGTGSWTYVLMSHLRHKNEQPTPRSAPFTCIVLVPDHHIDPHFVGTQVQAWRYDWSTFPQEQSTALPIPQQGICISTFLFRD